MATSASSAVITRYKELLATNADQTIDGISPSTEIDQLIGVGTAHQVYSLAGAPQWVLRVRMSKAPTPPAHLSLETEASRLAAEHHLAPSVAMRSDDGVSICQRVLMKSPSWSDHADLMRAIHQLSTNGLRAAEHTLSLADHAAYYWEKLTRDQQSNYGLSPLTPSIQDDLAQLDASAKVLCHNDLTPSNIGSWKVIGWQWIGTMLLFPAAISMLRWRPHTSLKPFETGLPGVLLTTAFAPTRGKQQNGSLY